MNRLLLAVVFGVSLCNTPAAVRQWTNTAGGNWFTPANWSPNGVPSAVDTASINVAGIYTVQVPTGSVAIANLTLGAATGTQTLLVGTSTPLAVTNLAAINANGLLRATNGGISGRFLIQPSGQLHFEGAASKNVYNLNLANRGTIVWSGGHLFGGSTSSTTISNGGAWQITGDGQIYQTYSGPAMSLVNAGTIVKSGGSGISHISDFRFTNRPAGLVQAASGTLQFNGGSSNQLGGQFSAAAPALINIASGGWSDAGGLAGGTGITRFNGGTLNLRTNIIQGLALTGGEVFVIANTFQQAGAITNLVLEGAQLKGTNRVGNGTLTVRSGGIEGRLAVQSGGVLNFTGADSKNVYNLHLMNQGTVQWSGGHLFGGSTSSTIISNGGLWEITGDNQIYHTYNGPAMAWTNSGTLRKSAGVGISHISDFAFANRPGGVVEAITGTLQFNNGQNGQIGGTWSATAPAIVSIASGTWTDAGGAAGGSGTTRFNGGTLNLRTNIIPGLRHTGGTLQIAASTFQQAGAITNLTLDGSQLVGTNRIGAGALIINSGGVEGQLTVLPPAVLEFASGANKNVYNLALHNQGAVHWNDGQLFGGSSSSTIISNGGVWEITGNNQIYQTYAGPAMHWLNTGTVRKSGGGGISHISDFNFVNRPSAVVQAIAGTLQFNSGNSNQLGGTFNAGAGAMMSIASGTWFDSGGTASGSGVNRFNGGTLNLRTNIIPNLALTGGEVRIVANTFQQGGSITNLALDGSQLRGTNAVGAGKLIVRAGGIEGALTVAAAGTLEFSGSDNKNVYNLRLINQGLVSWSGGQLFGGSSQSTTISNGGIWTITGNNQIYQTYSGPLMNWTNSGLIRKSGGAGLSHISDFRLVNLSPGIIQSDIGTLQLPSNFTNTTGALKLNGGTMQGANAIRIAGGTVTGAGNFGANHFYGGVLSPGENGPGLIHFPAGLNLNSAATLSMSGNGVTPGTNFDHLTVAGSVNLTNAALQITAAPSVPAGTTLLLIQNDGADPVNGTFNGLAENALLVASGQSFRIRYTAGSGNDVALVRDGGGGPPQLASGGWSNGLFRVRGAGGSSTIYVIQATTNFLQWTNVGRATGDVSGAFQFTDTNAFRFPYRYYRATN